MAVSAHRYSNGHKVDVALTSAVVEGDLIYAEGWLGFTPNEAASGESVALNIEFAEFDVILPTSLSLTKGAEVWVDVTDLTGHIPDSTAYYTASGSNRRRLGRCVSAQNGTTGQVRLQSMLREQ